MRIGIDARWIFRELSGIGTYTRELVKHLAEIDRQNEYVLFFDRAAALEEVRAFAHLEEAPNFSTSLLAHGPFSPWSQLVLPSLFTRLRLDVFHSANYMIPFLAFPRNRAGDTLCVVNLHDLIPLLFPHYSPRSKKARLLPLYRLLMTEVGRRADVIITGSSSARSDILRELQISNPSTVVVIPDGVDARFTPSGAAKAHTKTILYVGRLDPYKNVPRLVEAFWRVRQTAAPEATLRIVGPKDDRYPEAPRLAEKLGLGPLVQWAGYLTDWELVEAYRQAAVFVLPSRYEGFGLPALEAMACGTPVICSNAASLPEVVGDAAMQVDPDDVEGLAEAIARVLTDEALASTMREKGLRRAAQFSWRRTAQLTLEVFRSLKETKKQQV
ncbi:MAG: glycosyltransferase family 1 protein [Candidatus Eisenbacteria bacterium]|nr:glycosyltransferase family 1 protein [Candidatus Eisenbacteria bacterium]